MKVAILFIHNVTRDIFARFRFTPSTNGKTCLTNAVGEWMVMTENYTVVCVTIVVAFPATPSTSSSGPTYQPYRHHRGQHHHMHRHRHHQHHGRHHGYSRHNGVPNMGMRDATRRTAYEMQRCMANITAGIDHSGNVMEQMLSRMCQQYDGMLVCLNDIFSQLEAGNAPMGMFGTSMQMFDLERYRAAYQYICQHNQLLIDNAVCLMGSFHGLNACTLSIANQVQNEVNTSNVCSMMTSLVPCLVEMFSQCDAELGSVMDTFMAMSLPPACGSNSVE